MRSCIASAGSARAARAAAADGRPAAAQIRSAPRSTRGSWNSVDAQRAFAQRIEKGPVGADASGRHHGLRRTPPACRRSSSSTSRSQHAARPRQADGRASSGRHGAAPWCRRRTRKRSLCAQQARRQRAGRDQPVAQCRRGARSRAHAAASGLAQRRRLSPARRQPGRTPAPRPHTGEIRQIHGRCLTITLPGARRRSARPCRGSRALRRRWRRPGNSARAG